MDLGNIRLVIDMEPFWVKISTDDWSTKRSRVTVLPVVLSGALADGTENVPLKEVRPVAEVRWAVSVRDEALTSKMNFSPASLPSVTVEFLSRLRVIRSW